MLEKTTEQNERLAEMKNTRLKELDEERLKL